MYQNNSWYMLSSNLCFSNYVFINCFVRLYLDFQGHTGYQGQACPLRCFWAGEAISIQGLLRVLQAFTFPVSTRTNF